MLQSWTLPGVEYTRDSSDPSSDRIGVILVRPLVAVGVGYGFGEARGVVKETVTNGRKSLFDEMRICGTLSA